MLAHLHHPIMVVLTADTWEPVTAFYDVQVVTVNHRVTAYYRAIDWNVVPFALVLNAFCLDVSHPCHYFPRCDGQKLKTLRPPVGGPGISAWAKVHAL